MLCFGQFLTINIGDQLGTPRQTGASQPDLTSSSGAPTITAKTAWTLQNALRRPGRFFITRRTAPQVGTGQGGTPSSSERVDSCLKIEHGPGTGVDFGKTLLPLCSQ